MKSSPRVAIIGGGFSGVMVLANIVREAGMPIAIDLFEPSGAPGEGVAYGTKEPIHLLNVRAGNMGAFAGEQGHFYAWLQTPAGRTQAARFCPEKKIGEDDFAPRVLYGAYIVSILQEALAMAQAKNIVVTLHGCSVTRVLKEECFVVTAQNGEHRADALVLATGNLPPQHFSFATDSAIYIADSWKPQAGSIFPHDVAALSRDSAIAIIGTGLTAIDTILTLKKHGYPGRVVALSRSGWLPAPHAPATSYPAWAWVQNPAGAPRTALGLLSELRREIRAAEAGGHGWREVIDSLRPVTQRLWKQLENAEKRKAMRRLFTLWNIHRHRMAPEIASEIDTLQKSGQLRVMAARIMQIKPVADGLEIMLRQRGGTMETLKAALLINCTGPQYDIEKSGHALLAQLCAAGVITSHPLRVGIQEQEESALFAIGPLRLAELLECTAVPELREQAQHIAHTIVSRLT